MPPVKGILNPVIFYGLLVIIVLTAIPYGTVQPWWTALFECSMFVLGLLGLLDLLLTKSSLPKGAPLAIPAAALGLFILFQALPLFSSSNSVIPGIRLSASADPFSSYQLAIKLLALIVAGLLLLRYAHRERRLRTLVYVLIGVGLASSLLGVLRQGVSGPGWFFPLPHDNRGFAQFINRNHFGFLIEMTLGLTLGLIVRGNYGWQRYLVLVPAAAFLWIALIISNTRGGIFASLCQVLFLVIMLDPLRALTRGRVNRFGPARAMMTSVAVRVILIVFLISVFAYGVSWVGGEAVVSNFELAGYSFTEQGGKENRENVSRKDIWSATWKLIKAHPVIGSGFGGYWIAITKYHNASGTFTPQEAHNDYLEILASGGLIGFGLIAWFCVRLVKAARNSLRAPRSFVRAAALGAVTGIFGVMVHNFVDFGLHVTINALIFTALVAIAGREGLRRSAQTTALTEWQQFQSPEPDLAAY